MPIQLSLAGKLALITGGGRGLGKTIANEFAAAGANLVLTYNSTPADTFAEELSKKYNIRASAYKMAAEDSGRIASTLREITSKVGEPDILVSNAGVLHEGPAHESSDDVVKNTFEVNAFSPFYLAREAFKLWFPEGKGKKDKSIVIVGSISGHIHNLPQHHLIYNASKAAVIHIAKGLALEWAPYGVRVNTVSPGYINTDMTSYTSPELRAIWDEKTPLGRVAEPKEVADAIVYLSSPLASYCTGSDLLVDGGYTIP